MNFEQLHGERNKTWYIRKRTMAAVIITIIVLIITNKYWFIFKPMPVDFNIYGEGNCNINVQLNKKDNDEFTKIKQENISVNLDDTSHVYFHVNRSKSPKRIRIVLSEFKQNSPLVIKDIQLRYGKVKLDNLEKFKITGADFAVNNQELILTPSSNSIILTYPETLHIRAAIKLDFTLLIVIVILTFLLAYKLSNYLADFKTIQDKSRLDIIFLTIFFVFLFVPMSNISQEEISQKENRSLAKWKPWILENNEINFEFGRNFNDWFNDRFFTRPFLVNCYKSLRYKIAYRYYETGGLYLNKETNYMSSKFVTNAGNYYDDKRIKRICSNIKKFQEFCSKNNMKLYILIAPSKDSIPNKFSYPVLRAKSSNIYYQETKDAIRKINKETNQTIVYPYEEILELSKRTNTHFKTDHHWTDEGAYVGYLKLMEEIRKDFKTIKISGPSDFNYEFSRKVRVEPVVGYDNGFTYNAMGLHDEGILDTEYRYYNDKNSENIKLTYDNHWQDAYEFIYYENKNNINAPDMVLYGDSFTLNLLSTIKSSFHRTNNIYSFVADDSCMEKYINIKRFEKEILKSKPDILVYCTFDLGRLEYLYNAKEY